MSVNVTAQLPEARRRSSRGGPELCAISVDVKVVTPILGGGSQTRALDDVDVIRPSTVRGHLRFWWRALQGHEYSSAKDLYAEEGALWGQAAGNQGRRSVVGIRIDPEQLGGTDESDIDLQKTPGAYALWPARAERKTDTPAAARRKPGTQFRLTLIVPVARDTEIRNVVRAWLLFGGYGSRTRRGLGSFALGAEANAWLPATATPEALANRFGRDVFTLSKNSPADLPWLAGASLHVGKSKKDAIDAWTEALAWPKEFRQGTSGSEGDRAREPGTGKSQPNRPSISNWPEADKVRHLKGKTNAHPPRHNDTPAWPRAGFGLPIIGQFQTRPRRDGDKPYDEPGGFELRWRSGTVEHDRLGSPLIVKALPLADGTFVPCALWLNRAYPQNGEVVLKGDPNSGAPFDRLVASGDSPNFSALASKQSLREAFLDWLRTKYKTTVVAP